MKICAHCFRGGVIKHEGRGKIQPSEAGKSVSKDHTSKRCQTQEGEWLVRVPMKPG